MLKEAANCKQEAFGRSGFQSRFMCSARYKLARILIDRTFVDQPRSGNIPISVVAASKPRCVVLQ